MFENAGGFKNMKENYNRTLQACFVGYVVQAIVNNFVPLLFVTFQNSYQIPLSKITLLITINFLIQLNAFKIRKVNLLSLLVKDFILRIFVGDYII